MNDMIFADTSNLHELYQRADIIIEKKNNSFIVKSMWGDGMFLSNLSSLFSDIEFNSFNVTYLFFANKAESNKDFTERKFACCLILEEIVGDENKIVRLWANGNFAYEHGFQEILDVVYVRFDLRKF